MVTMLTASFILKSIVNKTRSIDREKAIWDEICENFLTLTKKKYFGTVHNLN